MLVVEVPRRRVLGNPLFLQVSTEGVDPTLLDVLSVLQESVVRADRDDEIAVRAYAHLERGFQIRPPSFLYKNLHSFVRDNRRQRVGVFDYWTVLKLLTSFRGVDSVFRPPLYQRLWAEAPAEVQKWGFVVIVPPREVCAGARLPP